MPLRGKRVRKKVEHYTDKPRSFWAKKQRKEVKDPTPKKKAAAARKPPQSPSGQLEGQPGLQRKDSKAGRKRPASTAPEHPERGEADPVGGGGEFGAGQQIGEQSAEGVAGEASNEGRPDLADAVRSAEGEQALGEPAGRAGGGSQVAGGVGDGAAARKRRLAKVLAFPGSDCGLNRLEIQPF